MEKFLQTNLIIGCIEISITLISFRLDSGSVLFTYNIVIIVLNESRILKLIDTIKEISRLVQSDSHNS